MGQGEMGIRMLGRIQVTSRWANDPVWLHAGRREIGQGRVREPPPDGNQVEGGEGRIRAEKGGEGRRRAEQVKKNRVAYVTINDRA